MLGAERSSIHDHRHPVSTLDCYYVTRAVSCIYQPEKTEKIIVPANGKAPPAKQTAFRGGRDEHHRRGRPADAVAEKISGCRTVEVAIKDGADARGILIPKVSAGHKEMHPAVVCGHRPLQMGG
jgi:hypothetical protein